MDRHTFERLVVEAVESLPEAFRRRMDNVAVVVEDWPDPETLRRAGVSHPAHLLGFYHGVPHLYRTHQYGLVPPDKITLYRGPILMRCRTVAEVRTLVEHVVRHELAHHFGIDDERLKELGAY
ncbi:MAG TPA: metallopeptidase family protein [Chloroflexi bacterium]|nr:metallopeptidase family protein [Chloroflexota bacterium]